jgi:hypothetical protein
MLMTVSVILVMLSLMMAPFHLPVNDGIRDPGDVGPDDVIPSLACE